MSITLKELDEIIKGEELVTLETIFGEIEGYLYYSILGDGVIVECNNTMYRFETEQILNTMSRVVKQPVFDYWHLISNNIDYFAMDKDGSWYGYSHAPITTLDDTWGNNYNQHEPCFAAVADLLTVDLFPKVTDWKRSLIKRPQEV